MNGWDVLGLEIQEATFDPSTLPLKAGIGPSHIQGWMDDHWHLNVKNVKVTQSNGKKCYSVDADGHLEVNLFKH